VLYPDAVDEIQLAVAMAILKLFVETVFMQPNPVTA
jgi:hypothetical protein